MNGRTVLNRKSAQPDIVVVGSGITGLMTAYYMAAAGYKVRVLSKSPDPRYIEQGMRFESSTWDGYVNRYITLTEGHPYLDLPNYVSVMYPDISEDFRVDITKGGMLALPMTEWNGLTQQFLQERALANADQLATQDLFLAYIDENRASMEMWYELLTEAVLRTPHLVNVLSLHSHGIDRFYDEEVLYRGALQAQAAQHIVKQRYGVDELRESNDFKLYWQGMARHNFIRGGGLTMYGLAFDVQALGREWLLHELEKQGVELCFGAGFEVARIEKDGMGSVARVKTQNGMLHKAKHIFFHTGAYAKPQLFEGTPAYGKLAGVKGLWMRIKNAQTLFGDTAPRPNKIHGGKYEVCLEGDTYQGQIADLNIMPKVNADGSWELVIGSGYLFVGIYPFEADLEIGEPRPDQKLEASRQAQVRLAEALALRAFVQVVSRVYDLQIDLESVLDGTDDQFDIPSKGCVRSWTPDDQELNVILPTTDGGVVFIDGGGNTGSTTKAPFNSKTLLKFVQSLEGASSHHIAGMPTDLEERYASIRCMLRKGREEISATRWQVLEDHLNEAVNIARGVEGHSNPQQ